MDSEYVKVEALAREILDRVLEDERTAFAALPTRLKAAAAETRSRYEDAVDALRREATERDERERARALSQAAFRARRRRADRCEELVEGLLRAGFDAACAAWDADPAGPHVTILVLEALTALAGSEFDVILPPATMAALPAEAERTFSRLATERTGRPFVLRLRRAEAGAGPGVVVASPDAHETYDNSLADRFRRAREGLRVRVAALLADEAASAS